MTHPASLAALRDPDGAVRAAAVRRAPLDLVGAYALRDVLLRDRLAPLRAAAAERLGRCDLEQPVVWLLDATHDPFPSVRDAALGALARIGGPSLRAPLRRLALEDPTWWVRRAAVRALGAAVGLPAVPALLEVLSDPFWRVRHSAIFVLEEMDAALTKWGDAQDKLAALATLTMEMKDAEEEEPTLFDSVD